MIALAALGAVLATMTRLLPLAHSERAPLWDEAKYAVSGLRLADALATIDLLAFVGHVHELATWPPGWPLVESLVLLLSAPFSEPSIATLRLLSLATFGLVAVATAWLAAQLTSTSRAPGPSEAVDRGASWAAVGLAVAWWLQGPLFQVHAVLGMLEVPSVLATALALGARLRADGFEDVGNGADGEERAAVRRWRLAWWLALALFFVKYNYGLLFLLAAGLDEGLRARGSARRLAAATVGALRRVRWRRPWSWWVAGTVAVALWIRITGGIEGELAGIAVRATSAGPPATVLLLLALLRAATTQRDATRRRWLAWSRSRPRWRAARWPSLVMVGWLAIPPHLKEWFGFVENRSSGLSAWEGVTYYPQVLAEFYTASPELAAAALASAVLVATAWMRSDPRRRVVGLLLGLHLLALWSHPYKLPRFAVIAAWLIGLVAAVGLASVPSRWRRGRFAGSEPAARLSWRSAAWAVVSYGLAVLALISLALISLGRVALEPVSPRVLAEQAVRTTAAQAAVDFLAEEAAAEPIVVLGTWNELSPGWLEFRVRAKRPRIDPSRLLTAVDLGHRAARVERSLQAPGLRQRAVWWIDDGDRGSARATRQAMELQLMSPLRPALIAQRGEGEAHRVGETTLWRYPPPSSESVGGSGSPSP